jgi:hypothetical protein
MRPRTRKPSPAPAPCPEDASSIDERYGLEPVFEPGDAEARAGAPGAAQFQSLQCPYCGEVFELLLDFSAGSTRCIEDCQICCQPIELDIEVDHEGALKGLTVQRSA